MDAEEALDRICVIVGWGSNPDPDDPEEALTQVLQVLNRYVVGAGANAARTRTNTKGCGSPTTLRK